MAWVRFSALSWTHDSAGFFYSRYPEPPAGKVLEAALSGQAVYYHRIGTPHHELSDGTTRMPPPMPTNDASTPAMNDPAAASGSRRTW